MSPELIFIITLFHMADKRLEKAIVQIDDRNNIPEDTEDHFLEPDIQKFLFSCLPAYSAEQYALVGVERAERIFVVDTSSDSVTEI